MKERCLVVFFLSLLLTNKAHSSLIQWDAFSRADSLAVKDESTGLVWLDLSVSAGLSYVNAAERFYGWQHASYQHVESLLDRVFPGIIFSGTLGNTYGFEQNCANTSTCYTSSQLWQSLFGSVVGSQYYQTHSYGLYEDQNDILRMGGSYLNGSGSANRYGTAFSSDYTFTHTNSSSTYYSTFLVKSDSLPQPVRPSPRTLLISTSGNTATQVSEPSMLLSLLILMPFILVKRRKRLSQFRD